MPGGYWEDTFDPRSMRNNREVNWREEISSKTAALCVIPSKTGLMFQHEIVHEGAFLRCEEFSRVILVELVMSFDRVTFCRLKLWGVGIENWQVGKRVAIDLAHNSKFVR